MIVATDYADGSRRGWGECGAVRREGDAPCRMTGRVVALLALLLPLLFLQLVWGQCASGNKDPHLNFAHGGTADFRGRDKTYYCFFSAPRLCVNVLIEDATFVINDDRGSLTVDGSYITQVHIKPVHLSVRVLSCPQH